MYYVFVYALINSNIISNRTTGYCQHDHNYDVLCVSQYGCLDVRFKDKKKI